MFFMIFTALKCAYIKAIPIHLLASHPHLYMLFDSRIATDRKQPTEWEEYFTAIHPTKGWYPGLCRRLRKCNKKTTSPIKTWPNDLSRHFPKKEIQIVNNIKQCWKQIGYHLTLARIVITKKTLQNKKLQILVRLRRWRNLHNHWWGRAFSSVTIEISVGLLLPHL